MKKLILLLVLAVVLTVTASANTDTNYMQDMIDAAVRSNWDTRKRRVFSNAESGRDADVVAGIIWPNPILCAVQTPCENI